MAQESPIPMPLDLVVKKASSSPVRIRRSKCPKCRQVGIAISTPSLARLRLAANASARERPDRLLSSARTSADADKESILVAFVNSNAKIVPTRYD